MLANSWKIYYYIDFLSKYFKFSSFSNTYTQDQAWLNLLGHKGFCLLVSSFLNEKYSKKTKFELVEREVLKLSNKVHAIFNKKLILK